MLYHLSGRPCTPFPTPHSLPCISFHSFFLLYPKFVFHSNRPSLSLLSLISPLGGPTSIAQLPPLCKQRTAVIPRWLNLSAFFASFCSASAEQATLFPENGGKPYWHVEIRWNNCNWVACALFAAFMTPFCVLWIPMRALYLQIPRVFCAK